MSFSYWKWLECLTVAGVSVSATEAGSIVFVFVCETLLFISCEVRCTVGVFATPKTVINQISPYFSALFCRLLHIYIFFCPFIWVDVNRISSPIFAMFRSIQHDDVFNDIIRILCSFCVCFDSDQCFGFVLTMFARRHGKTNDEIWINEHDKNWNFI